MPGHKRPKIDEAKIIDLASIGCSDFEISKCCGCSEDYLHNHYRAMVDLHRAGLHQSLRRKQIEIALKGNITMLIFLGKCYLNQFDTAYIETKNVNNIFEDPETVKAKLKELVMSKMDRYNKK